MKRYLIRSGFSPLEQYKPNDVFFNRLVAGNSGNMMFVYGIMNVLTTETSSVIPTYYKLSYSPKEIDKINSNYDAFLIPLADAFRPDFVPFLEAYTELIKKLSIPCVLMSVGIRAPITCNGDVSFPFDDKVKCFLNAILDHSSLLGVRGAVTGNYLKKLGYKEGKHFTIIGCPSLYTYGNNIHIDSSCDNRVIGFGLSPYENSNVEVFLNNLIKRSERSILLFQLEEEFKYSYIGTKPPYFNSLSHSREQIIEQLENSSDTVFFYSVPNWLDYLNNQIDLFIGDRFHGVVSGVLSNKKHIIVPIDARTKELAEYHDLTRIYENELDPSSQLDFETFDFHSFEKKQPLNLAHYIDFLHANDLVSVYDNPQIDISPGNSPLERLIYARNNNACLQKHYHELNTIEKIERLLSFHFGDISNRIMRKVSPQLRG